MALIEVIFVIILVTIIVGLFFKLFHSVIKTILITLLLISALFGVFTYFVYKDAMELKDNFPNSTKIIYVGDKNELLAGFSFVDLSQESIKYITLSELEQLTNYYTKNDYKSLNKEAYKTFVIDISIFDSVFNESIIIPQEGLGLPDLEIEGELINETLHSETPKQLIIEQLIMPMVDEQIKLVPNYNVLPAEMIIVLKEEMKNKIIEELQFAPGELKALIVGLLFKQLIEEKGPLILYEEFKKDQLIVYKETPVFKLLKFTPNSLISVIADEAMSKN